MIPMDKAVILCEKGFGKSVGKTANGLVRLSKKYRITGVIDSSCACRDAGSVLDGQPRGIPVVSSIDETIRDTEKPDWLIIGFATIGGFLPQDFRPVVRQAIRRGIGVISGLHEGLGEDPEFSELAESNGVDIVDIRRQPPFRVLHHFGNLAMRMNALRIPILGMDGSIGKRTTGWILLEALERAEVRSEFIATGQTGLLQGAEYGLPLDAIGGDFMVGELEHQIDLAYREKNPEVILIEGQGSISHPAYVCGTRAILTASSPSAIILQCAPGRKFRNYHKDELHIPMPTIESEIQLLESFSGSEVIALTMNPEELAKEEVDEIIRRYRTLFRLPVCDPITQSSEEIVGRIVEMLR